MSIEAAKEILIRMATEMAAVRLSDEELEQLVPHITGLLEGLETLNELDLSKVEPAVIFTMAEGRSNGQ